MKKVIMMVFTILAIFLLIQASNAEIIILSHDVYVYIGNYEGQQAFIIYPGTVSAGSIGEITQTGLCSEFCGGLMQNCVCDKPNGRMILTFKENIDYSAGDNALKWLEENTDKTYPPVIPGAPDISYQPMGLLPLFRDIYNPIVQNKKIIGYIDTYDGGDNIITVSNRGKINNGVFNIGNINFPIGSFITTDISTGALVSNAQINFKTQRIMLNQYGIFETRELPITCSFNDQSTTVYASQIKDSIKVYNYEKDPIEIPLNKKEIDDCSMNFFERIALQFKQSETSWWKTIFSGKTEKPDSFCIKAKSNFLAYFNKCSFFSETGEERLTALIGEYKKSTAEMNPNNIDYTTFSIYYNVPRDNTLYNVMYASNKFDFQLGTSDSTTQKYFDLTAYGRALEFASVNEQKVDKVELKYNNPAGTYYNLGNLFKISEEDKKENLGWINENNPKLTVIDSTEDSALDVIKTT